MTFAQTKQTNKAADSDQDSRHQTEAWRLANGEWVPQKNWLWLLLVARNANATIEIYKLQLGRKEDVTVEAVFDILTRPPQLTEFICKYICNFFLLFFYAASA